MSSVETELRPDAEQRSGLTTFEMVALGSVGLALAFAFLTPPEMSQGQVARLFYLHIPSVGVAYLAFLGSLVASVFYLFTKRRIWDSLADGCDGRGRRRFHGLHDSRGHDLGKAHLGGLLDLVTTSDAYGDHALRLHRISGFAPGDPRSHCPGSHGGDLCEPRRDPKCRWCTFR